MISWGISGGDFRGISGDNIQQLGGISGDSIQQLAVDMPYRQENLRGRESFRGETVPDGIPPAAPWEQLEKKRKIPAKVKSIRGKLNVPRERFHLTSDGRYRWAGKE